MKQINDRLYSWASDIDEVTILQAEKTARVPIIHGHVALMPDAHLGSGATIGSVIPTLGSIIPSAVGVDIGCGMIAVQTELSSTDLPDTMDGVIDAVEGVVPAGLGKWHANSSRDADRWLSANKNEFLTDKQNKKALLQFGTLGSGNHFFEICLDENDNVWVVMHSGSRGVGNQLAVQHIRVAKALAKQEGIPLEDPELAWFQENTPEFDDYIRDMTWSQDYAMANRKKMMSSALNAIFSWIGTSNRSTEWINCHHNFAARESHGGKDIWVTRKGAIKADVGDMGVIPGSMGGKSFIIQGLGNSDSYNSCSHGAGRRMSRTQAKKTFTEEDMKIAMKGSIWQSGKAKELIDEIPHSYKDIDQVMADQADLVEIVHTLQAIVNYKGTS